MSMYAAFAQKESKNMSDNIKWGIKERMKSGKVCLNTIRFLGYKKDKNGNLVIIKSKAIIVREKFELYLLGFGVRKFKKYLENNKIKTVTGEDTCRTLTINKFLLNEKYVGDILMQKYLRKIFLIAKFRKLMANLICML